RRCSVRRIATTCAARPRNGRSRPTTAVSSSRSSWPEQALVEPIDAPDERVDAEALLDAGARGGAEPRAEGWVGDELQDRRGERLGPLGRDEERVLSVLAELGGPADGGG